MSLPLGHLAIGMTAYDICSDSVSVFRHWRTAALVAALANLPDIDMIIGLILQGNGSAFHRGPTHSIVFALLMALLAANGWKIMPQLPKIGFPVCFIIILSHLLADFSDMHTMADSQSTLCSHKSWQGKQSLRTPF